MLPVGEPDKLLPCHNNLIFERRNGMATTVFTICAIAAVVSIGTITSILFLIARDKIEV